MEVFFNILHSQKIVGCFMRKNCYTCVCFILFLLSIQGSDCVEEIYLKEYNDTVDYSPNLFQNFDEILKFFLREENRHLPYVKEAINIFRGQCAKHSIRPSPSGRRKPFIAIEGLHRPTRRAISRNVASLLRGSMLQNPPKCLINLKFKFESGPLKRAFHALSLYASGFIARRIVSLYPVVMNGYWFDQMSFSVARTFRNYSLPPPDSKVYQWPRDLVPPDIIFLVVNEKIVYDRYPTGTKSPDDVLIRMLEVCRRMRGVPIVELDTTISYSHTVNQIKAIIEERFSNVFDFYFSDYGHLYK